MTTEEIVLLIVAFPFLVFLGLVLIPIIFAAIFVVLSVISFVVSLVMLPFAWLICKYNEWSDRKYKEREWNDIVKWKEENPEAYQWARDNPGK